ncbi:hypothetical protein ESCO_005392 [Escovopsis weberi]|uniref:RGS domain-containing protein n=1 Tax=Escovopsis weberi TaxID=150374 RepID=A0A0M8N0H4_ESCWE|nr:hypothetical protein ESCO_005392 [Escovopsis weberi]
MLGSELGISEDTKPELRFDGVGIFYCVFATIWTLILASGMAFLWVRREMPILRIRGLPLSFAAITLMHLYWLAVELGYSYGPLMPEVAEYWIMSIWFPFGIALFHASNSRFLYVADAQRKFLNTVETLERPLANNDLVGRWKRMDYTSRTLLLVSLGMAGQLFLTVFMYLISQKFHSGFGIPGTGVSGNYMQVKMQQGRGWEWWPSIFWQMTWAWVYAPYILWRSRNLRDTQGWRFQTIACCLSNLHAAPMWLIAIYVPAMNPINTYFIPPQWIAVSIMLLEIFTVFVPVIEVCKHRSLTQETLDSIARWETRKKAFGGGAGKSLHSQSTATSSSSWYGRKGRASSVHTSHSAGGSSILTMDALEHTLAKNPEPLQHFSALKDFSGENIAFLTRIREWKMAYFPRAPQREGVEPEKRESVAQPPRECFDAALRIYLDFISATHAEFQINLSSTDFKNLQAVFEHAARVIYGDGRSTPDPVTPFDDMRSGSADSDATLNVVRYWGDLPEAFCEEVFDDAEMHVKYLVLTNTWPKFIKERRSFDALSTAESAR